MSLKGGGVGVLKNCWAIRPGYSSLFPIMMELMQLKYIKNIVIYSKASLQVYKKSSISRQGAVISLEIKTSTMHQYKAEATHNTLMEREYMVT